MPNLTVDEIVTQKHVRLFVQFGGARPGNVARYAGQDAQYMMLDGVTVPELGGIDAIRVPDLSRAGKYRLIGRMVKPQDLPKASLTLLEKHGSIPRQLGLLGCAFNIYQVTGTCKDLSDFTNGWSDYVLIVSGAVVTEKDFGDRNAFDDDKQLTDKLSLVIGDVYPVGAIAFELDTAQQPSREIVDVVYGSTQQCGECAAPDDGTQRIYALSKSSGSGSPGLPAEILYSTDGGVTYTSINPTGIGASEDPVAMKVVGPYLVVLSRTAGSATSGGYYYASIDVNTGIPGAFTKVVTGFVSGKQPNDMTVLSPREVFFAADGGYIYKSTDITSGVTVMNPALATTSDLLRIRASASSGAIVATGRASTVVRSTNRGQTFISTTTNPSVVALDVTAVEVLDNNRIWVGTANSGRVFYTLNGGATWVEKGFARAGSGTVRDIVFATDDVGFFSHDDTTPTARIFTTWNGGQDWMTGSPRMVSLPTFNRANRIGLPNADSTTAANTISIAGLAGDGTSGALYLGVAGRL